MAETTEVRPVVGETTALPPAFAAPTITQRETTQVRDPSEAPESLRHRIRRFMAANLHRRPTLKDLAVFLGYSEKYCSDLFKVMMGEPFSQYGKRLRLAKAHCLLAEGRTTPAEIADRLGFSDQFAFSRFFKKAVGCAPNHFRLRSRETPDMAGKAR